MTIKKFALGSNQYKKIDKKAITMQRRQKGLSNTRLVILGVTAFVSCYLFNAITPTTFNGEAMSPTHLKLLNPLSQKVYAQEARESARPTEHEEIRLYILQVFGEDAPKVFKLLACENSAFNPKAVNDNTQWGGVGQDIGVFQINTIWQGVSNKAFLFDWKINVDIAHNIYTRDGSSFKLWTCGKKLGI